MGETWLSVDGHQTTVSRGKQQLLLAAFALWRGQVVSAATLVDLLWEEGPPSSARTTLRGHVKRLRARLRNTRSQSPIEAVPGGYRLVADEDEIDIHRFRRLVNEARAMTDPQAELTALGTAMRLWRGRPLAGLEATRWVDGVASKLTEEWLQAVERLCDLEIENGGANAATVLLRETLAEHPLRESLWCRLILALHCSGRSAEALLTYERARQLLADRLGVPPAGPLRDLHQRILMGKQPSAALRPRRGSEVFVQSAPAPAPASTFVGRRQCLSALDQFGQRDAGAPLVVIDGPAGVGKSALALHWAQREAHRFPGGYVTVNLRGPDFSAPPHTREVLGELLVANGMREGDLPDTEHLRAAALRDTTARRPMLVVLDNAQGVDQVRPLLPSLAGTVLITSHQQLRGLVVRDGANRLSVEPLSPEEGQELVAALTSPAQVHADPAAVKELVELCAGLPLALSVAAEKISRVPGLSLAALVHELRDESTRLDLLETGDDCEASIRMALTRQQRLLGPAEADLLCRLSWFATPEFSSDDAARIAGGETSELRLHMSLSRLASTNILSQRGPHRYHLHALQRAVARESSPVAELTGHLSTPVSHESCPDSVCPEAGRQAPARNLDYNTG